MTEPGDGGRATELVPRGQSPMPRNATITAVSGYTLTAVDFDFTTKTHRSVELGQIRASISGGHFVWIDLDFTKIDAAKQLLSSLGVASDQVLEDITVGEAGTQLGRFPEYYHVVVSGCRLGKTGLLDLERVDIIFSDKYLVTLHEGPRLFLDMVRRDFVEDFVRYAKSPSFLIYEIFDDLLEHYVGIQKALDKRVDSLQAELFATTDDSVFAKVSEIGENLLRFRSVLTPMRTVLTELATRRSSFVSEATQSFLGNMVGTVERVLQDVLADRDILSQSVNLYVSMVSHRTNRAMNKLTVISTIFLPLTFLCGVYGMNFDFLPELKWRYGYVMFWALCFGIAAGLVALMRKNRLL